MSSVIDALTQAPTVGFTALLAFSLAWWIASLAAGSLGGHHGGHGAHGARVGRASSPSAPGNPARGGRAGTRSSPARIGRWFGIGSVPLSLLVMFASFGGWSVALVASLAAGEHRSVVVDVTIGLGATLAGLLLSGLVSRPAKRIFEVAAAPSHADALGALCRVRTAYADGAFGQADVISGPLKGSLIGIRTTGDRVRRGTVVLVIEQHGDAPVFLVTEADDALFD